MSYTKRLKKLLAPDTIAIVGASDKKHKVGNLFVKNTSSFGYLGTVYYINHKAKKIAGKTAYPSIAAIGKKIDVAIIVVPGDAVYDVIRDAAPWCKNFVVISAGFSERGIAGHNKEMALQTLAQQHNLVIVGPNCLGFLNPRIALNASFAPGMPPIGDTAFISQSGALAVALIDRAKSLDIGFSFVVSIGNKMQISEVDFISFLAQDPHTKTIVLYLESIVGGTDFLNAVLAARAKGKRVIILKSGKTDQAQKAISLHTGSLTSSDAITQAVFAKIGVLRAHTIDDIFLFTATAHLLPPQKKTPALAIITNAGGPGVIATDALAQCTHIKRAHLKKQTQEHLRATLPRDASVHNPIDLLGDAKKDRYEIALDACIKDTHVDMIMIILTPQDRTPSSAIAQMIVARQRETKKPLITSFIGGDAVAHAQQTLRAGDVLHAETPSALLRAINQIVAHDHNPSYTLPDYHAKKNPRAHAIIAAARRLHLPGLYFAQARKFFRAYDIPVSAFWDITDGIGTKTHVEYPCVAKVDDVHILHKSDRGGVILPITNTAALYDALTTLQKRFPEPTARIIAQPLLPRHMELIIGMKRDPLFGVIIIVGLGGIYTEVFHKREIFIAPFARREIKKRLRHGVLHFLFDGTRHQKPYDLTTLTQTLMALQDLAYNHPDVRAIDINPFLLYNDAHPSCAVDIKVLVS